MDEWGYCPVKLVTPVMTYADPSFGEIECVLTLLMRDFNTIINDTCSLNVHVGNIAVDSKATAAGQHLQSLGFSLTALENLLSFVWIYQNQLNALHPESRISKDHCLGPSILLSHLNPRIVKQEIQSCTSMQALSQLWDGSANLHKHTADTLAYSIQDMTAHSSASGDLFESGNRTVRFGQHRSTLVTLEIYHWVMLVGHLVRLADRCIPWCPPLAVVVGRDRKLQAEICEVGTVQLLEEIDAEEQADFYAGRLHEHESCC
ncbi:hypothetical protein FQN49_005114 [Arthroderma sp. PD_2]|nr:hypothetical protein FQN49_005114 [Arthroderma sp. PD_2]